MLNIRPLRNGIFFKFEDDIAHNTYSGFRDVTESGLYLGVNMDRSTKQPRWGVVLSVGKDVIDCGIVPGTRICVEALKWTNEFKVDGVTFWKTDEDHILLVD